MSGWLKAQENNPSFAVEGADIHGLMEVVHGVSEEELDFILHSPGGSPEAAEQMVEYRRTRFHYIRAFVPLQAKSAATMIVMGGDEIVLGDHSELGPIDPQILIPVPEGQRFAPAHAILRDFQRAKDECSANVASLATWTPILRSYSGGLIEFCTQQIKLSVELISRWLERYRLTHQNMAVPDTVRSKKAREIAEYFGSEEAYDRFRTHGRPMRFPELQQVGLRVRRLEEDDALQDAVLSVYHVTDISFNGPAVKCIENHLGKRNVRISQRMQLQLQNSSRPPWEGRTRLRAALRLNCWEAACTGAR